MVRVLSQIENFRLLKEGFEIKSNTRSYDSPQNGLEAAEKNQRWNDSKRLPMTDDLTPTETVDHTITVIARDDSGDHERIDCSTYQEAIDTTQELVNEYTVVQIEARDGDLVFRSDTMDIDDWANEWRRAKRRLAVDVEEYDCPYDNVGCIAEDLCGQCKLDKLRNR